MENIILSLKNFSLSLGTEKVLDNISFKIFKGEYVGLIGPNGAGKSSLMLSIMKHYKPSAGKIFLAQDAVIGYVPQRLQLQNQFSMSVGEFLSMGIRQSLTRTKSKQLMIKSLADVGLSVDFLQKNLHSLSGGQQQRIVIARAIIHNPNFLLFDEPLQEVDSPTKIKIYQLLSYLNQQHAITILFVSHEINYVIEQTKRILCLDKKLYSGCHPLEFSKSISSNCQRVQQDSFHSETTLIHHHH